MLTSNNDLELVAFVADGRTFTQRRWSNPISNYRGFDGLRVGALGRAFRATRAITIAAPPEPVWPWLVQIGCTRAGWYSHDLLDNRGRPSATTIEAAWQDL